MFPVGAQLKRTNFAAITAREADAIEAALRADPAGIPEIAAAFNRSENTIRRIGERRGISRRSSTSTNANSQGAEIKGLSAKMVGIKPNYFGETESTGA